MKVRLPELASQNCKVLGPLCTSGLLSLHVATESAVLQGDCRFYYRVTSSSTIDCTFYSMEMLSLPPVVNSRL